MASQSLAFGSRQSSTRGRDATWGAGAADRLLQVVDVCLMSTIFVAPYFMGGRHPVGRTVVVLLALVMATAWTTRQCLIAEGRWRGSWTFLLLVAAVLLDVFQIIPLPQHLLQTLSPHTAQILPTMTTGGQALLAAWPCISMTPAETRDGLVMLTAQILIFLVTVQRVRDVGDVERMLRWIAGGVTLMAVVGLLQYAASNGKFLWVYEHPYRDTDVAVKGSFINRNHFAHFLALGLGPLCWWIATELRRRANTTAAGFTPGVHGHAGGTFGLASLMVALAVVLFAGLLTLSRGGALAMAVALTVSTLVMYRASAISWRYLVSLLGIVLLLGVALLVHGFSRVAFRLDDIAAGTVTRLDANGGRRRIWEANWSAFLDHRLLGTGVGSQREVYPMYLKDWIPFEFVYAESGYFQIASEMGGAGLALLFCAIASGTYWCLRVILGGAARRETACLAALAGSLAASVVHSLVDFVWYIPACLSLTAITAACALRIFQMSRPAAREGTVLARPVWWVAVAMLFGVGTWMVGTELGPALAATEWDSYLRDSDVLSDLSNSANNIGNGHAAADQQPGAPVNNPLKSEASTDQICRSMIDHLTKVLRVSPNDARAQMRMAGTYLLRFGELQQHSANAMSLSQLCDAAMHSHFRTRQELDEWLRRAIGDNVQCLQRALWHTRRALSLCPLQGEGYIYLAELCFLEGAGSDAKAAYIAQALRVRPYDDAVLFEAGKETMLLGDVDAAIGYWKRSFHQGGSYRAPLIQLLTGHVPVAEFLEKFEPTVDDWPAIQATYCRLHRPDELQQLCAYYAGLAQRSGNELAPDKRSQLWLTTSRVYRDLNDLPRAVDCCRRAYQCTPDDWDARYALCTVLWETRHYDEAEQHLHWCLQREPENPALQLQWRELVVMRVAAQGTPSTTAAAPSYPMR